MAETGEYHDWDELGELLEYAIYAEAEYDNALASGDLQLAAGWHGAFWYYLSNWLIGFTWIWFNKPPTMSDHSIFMGWIRTMIKDTSVG